MSLLGQFIIGTFAGGGDCSPSKCKGSFTEVYRYHLSRNVFQLQRETQRWSLTESQEPMPAAAGREGAGEGGQHARQGDRIHGWQREAFSEWFEHQRSEAGRQEKMAP